MEKQDKIKMRYLRNIYLIFFILLTSLRVCHADGPGGPWGCTSGSFTVEIDFSKAPGQHNYIIGDYEEYDDIVGMFTTSPSECTTGWYLNVYLLTGLPANDTNAVRYDYSSGRVIIHSVIDSSAGDYHVRIEAIDNSNQSELVSF